MQINQNSWKQRLILVSFVASLILSVIKFVAYAMTNSNAILSDALESIINVLASGFAFYSIRLSSQPKDRNHPYGHGKIEFFSGGFEGGLIFIAAIVIIYTGILRLFHPAPLDNLTDGGMLLSVTALFNGLFGYFLVREGGKVNSIALSADGKHLISDAFSTLLLLVSLALTVITGFVWIDAASSVLFGGIIGLSGLQLVRKSVGGLMDESDPALLREVVQTIKANKKDYWVDVHNVRVQQYGSDLHIDCHLTLPFYWPLQESHQAVTAFEEVLKAAHQGETEIFVHSDPCLPQCCQFCKLQNCYARSHDFVYDIDWDVINLAKNQKLFADQIDATKT